MGRRKKKKHFKKYKSVQQTIQPVTVSQQNLEPVISLENDTDVQKPTTPVVSEIKKISIIMTLLVFVVAVVATINIQTDWVNNAGQWLMNLLHIYGA